MISNPTHSPPHRPRLISLSLHKLPTLIFLRYIIYHCPLFKFLIFSEIWLSQCLFNLCYIILAINFGSNLRVNLSHPKLCCVLMHIIKKFIGNKKKGRAYYSKRKDFFFIRNLSVEDINWCPILYLCNYAAPFIYFFDKFFRHAVHVPESWSDPYSILHIVDLIRVYHCATGWAR